MSRKRKVIGQKSEKQKDEGPAKKKVYNSEDVEEEFESESLNESEEESISTDNTSESGQESSSDEVSSEEASDRVDKESNATPKTFGSHKQARSIDESHRIFLGRLPKTTTHEEVKAFFAKYGDVEWVKLLRFPDTKKLTGAAFLAFREESSVHEVLDSCKGSLDFHGTSIRVTSADEKPVVTKKDKKREEKKKNVRSVYVGNLAWKTTEKSIIKHFKDVGRLKNVSIPILKANKKPRGFAIIEFEDESLIEKAVKLKHGTTLDGRVLKVESMNKE